MRLDAMTLSVEDFREWQPPSNDVKKCLRSSAKTMPHCEQYFITLFELLENRHQASGYNTLADLLVYICLSNGVQCFCSTIKVHKIP
ncbi:hypothetical protein Ciccas_005715 [Cichlidogyrus casuarinus]|uniref:Uncharacterized protein n=1 Tax=Cichlidogyrus casuarinus TaxID=1844966 RepID=A0ABD2Q8U7_9PLAT